MPDVVTRRPRTGRAYGSPPSVSNETWNKIKEPGGRKLWIKLVLVFTLVVLLGICLIALGASLFKYAYDFHDDGNTALPMGLCIVSIVSGMLLFCGGIILGNLVISSKWRKNRQPNYNRRNTNRTVRVRYRASIDDIATDIPDETDRPPPPYDSGTAGQQPTVFFLSGNLAVPTNLPPPPDIRLDPPEYTEESVKPPSYSSINPIGIHTGHSSAVKTSTDSSEQTLESESNRNETGFCLNPGDQNQPEGNNN